MSSCITTSGPLDLALLLQAGSYFSRDISLLSFYSLGLAIPFVLSGYFMNKFLTTRKGFSKYYGRVTKTGGAILLITGILIATNQIQVISYYILTMFPFLTTLG